MILSASGGIISFEYSFWLMKPCQTKLSLLVLLSPEFKISICSTPSNNHSSSPEIYALLALMMLDIFPVDFSLKISINWGWLLLEISLIERISFSRLIQICPDFTAVPRIVFVVSLWACVCNVGIRSWNARKDSKVNNIPKIPRGISSLYLGNLPLWLSLTH